MRFGLAEIVIIFIIALILVGPKVFAAINRAKANALRRAEKQSIERARQMQAAAMARQAKFAKIKMIAYIVLGVFLVLTIIYFIFWPVAVDVKPYNLAQPSGLTVEQLQSENINSEQISILPYVANTPIQIYDGWVYVSAVGGKMLRLRENGTGLTELFTASGEIMSFDFDTNGDIIFTQLQYENQTGALMKASFDGLSIKQEALATNFSGQNFAYLTAVTVAKNGDIYFCNASEVSALELGAEHALRTELLAHTSTGAVYHYDAKTQSTTLMAYNLSFPSGLALDEANKLLYVSELTAAQILALPLTTNELDFTGVQNAANSNNQNTVQSPQIIAAGLGAYPTALSYENDLLQAEFLTEQIGWLEALSEQVFLRKVILRLPSGTVARLIKLN